MNKLYKYLIAVDRHGPTGFRFAPIEQVEVDDEFYYSRDFSKIIQYENIDKEQILFFCEDEKTMNIFSAGLASFYGICRNFGANVKNGTFGDFCERIPKG